MPRFIAHLIPSRRDAALTLLLAALMAATRGHHPVLPSLPDASQAVFLLAGLAVAPAAALPLLLILALSLDAAHLSLSAAGALCLTPAYACLLPAYGALWLAGRVAGLRRQSWGMVGLAAAVVVGTALSELFAGGGYYLLSGHFAAPSWTEFATRVARYYPPMLAASVLWVGVVLAVGSLAGAARPKARQGAR